MKTFTFESRNKSANIFLNIKDITWKAIFYTSTLVLNEDCKIPDILSGNVIVSKSNGVYNMDELTIYIAKLNYICHVPGAYLNRLFKVTED